MVTKWQEVRPYPDGPKSLYAAAVYVQDRSCMPAVPGAEPEPFRARLLGSDAYDTLARAHLVFFAVGII